MAKKPLNGLSEQMYYILMSLLKNQLCGIEIAEFIEKKTNYRIKIGPATLYTILSKFCDEKLIEQVAVDGRKRTYKITQSGEQLFITEFERLKQCVLDSESEVL